MSTPTRAAGATSGDEGPGVPPPPPAQAGSPAPRPRHRRAFWGRVAGAAVAGGAAVLAFPPYGIWPLAILSVAALALLTRGVRVRQGALIGLAYGLAFFVPLLSWSGIFVGPAPWLILSLAEAAYVAGLGAALAGTSRLPAWPVWAAALWVAQEALRDRWPFGGFPWGRLAFSQADSPLGALAAYGGAPLVSFAVALTGTALALIPLAAGTRRDATPRAATASRARAAAGSAGATAGTPGEAAPGRVGLVAQVAVVVGVLLAGVVAAAAGPWQTPVARQVTVAVIQGNVPRLGLDFNAQREAVLRNHADATTRLAADVAAGRAQRPDLVLWPENASDIDPIRYPDAAARIDAAAKAIGVPILVGTLADGPTEDTVRNVGIVWDPATGPGERYVKRHPVPFAEYIPLRPIARMVSKDVDRVGRDFVGGDTAGLLKVGPVTVGDVICFEVAYDGIVRNVSRSDLLVVQTNNATFGDSHETWQQLAMGRLRAVEHGRTTLVAATSGVSAVIAPDGDITQRSDVFTPDVIVRTVEVRKGTTLATRLGAGPEWAAVVAALGALAVAVRRRSPREKEGTA